MQPTTWPSEEWDYDPLFTQQDPLDWTDGWAEPEEDEYELEECHRERDDWYEYLDELCDRRRGT